MRRRVMATSVADHLAPFTAPTGDIHEVWEAWVRWDAAMTAHQAAHPKDEDACDYARANSTVPDAPFDPSEI